MSRIKDITTQSQAKQKTKKVNYCDICDKNIIGNLYKFKAHLYLHKNVQPRFHCMYCSKQFFRKDTFSKHVTTHGNNTCEKNKYKKSHTCGYCDRTFIEKRNLVIHLKNIHDEEVKVPNVFKCMACDATYCERRLLDYHVRKTHYNLKKEEQIAEKDLNETWVETVKKTNVCVEITKVNENIITIKKCNMQAKEVPIKTEGKPTTDKYKQYIKSELAQENHSHYSKAICDYCKKVMLKKSLISHMREKHLKLKRFHCDGCEKRFSRHYQLINHECGKLMRRRKLSLKN